jgi:lysylphosphatidylglycerol synthetase-like protein (DUF2156 family)
VTAVQHLGEVAAEQRQGAPVMPPWRPGSFLRDELRRRLSLRRLARLARELCKRNPATMCFLAALWATGLATGSIAHGPSRWLAGYVRAGLPALGHGYWWSPLSTGLWASSLGGYLAITGLSLVILAPAERRMGITRTFVTLLVSQVAGLLLAVGLVRLAQVTHQPGLSAMGGETTIGALPGVLGVGFALSSTLSPSWRRRLWLLLTTAIAVSVMYIGHLEQVALACGAAAGHVVGTLTDDRARPWAGPRGPRYKARVLVGVLVAGPALGAILAELVVSAHGPMSLSNLLSIAQGRSLPEQRLYAPWTGVPVEAGPALLLLLCAYGLRRGRREAWWLAVMINLAVLAVSIWVASTVDYGHSARVARLDNLARAIPAAREAAVLSVVTLVALLLTRRHFDQNADRRAVRKVTATLAIAVIVSCGAFLLLGYLPHDRPGPRHDLPLRFLASTLYDDHFLQAGLVGRLLYGSVFLLFWIVALGALTAFFLHTGTDSDTGAAERARAILTRGGSTLSYMSTWAGNAYWISQDGRAAIAYRAVAGVALTIGEPYGDPAALDYAIPEFVSFCEHRGLQPCLYSVTARTRAVTQRLGWRSVQIAKDNLIPLGQLKFAGKKWQAVRSAQNKAAREGITAEWWSYQEMPPELRGQVRQISGKWVADKALPEMNFMLGGLDELNDPNVRCLIAVGADRKLQAITSWLPVYDGGRQVGWTLDLMRRNTEGTVHGVMEFLIATAALTFQEEGARFASLAGAPLAGLDHGDAGDCGEQPWALQRALDMIADTMEPAYGFQSLSQFKDKFQPVYEPLYLAYPDQAALGPIALAIGSVYLPNAMSWQGLRMLTTIRRPHAGGAQAGDAKKAARTGRRRPGGKRSADSRRASRTGSPASGRPAGAQAEAEAAEHAGVLEADGAGGGLR